MNSYGVFLYSIYKRDFCRAWRHNEELVIVEYDRNA